MRNNAHLPIKTFDPSNQFSFTCPVFGAQTKMAQCLALRDLKWRGEHVPMRHGCQVAMTADRCPIPSMVRRLTRQDADPYFSAEPKLGKLEAVDLQAVERVLIPAKLIETSACSEAEKKHLRACNERGGNKGEAANVGLDQVDTPRRVPAAAPRSEPEQPVRKAIAGAPAIEGDEIPEFLRRGEAPADAAKTGDFSAAINAAVSQDQGDAT